MDTDFCERIWNKIQSKSSDWKKIHHDELIRLSNFLTENTTENSTNDNVCFIFCIDEARVLISPNDEQSVSPFRFLRRALREIR